MNFTPNELLYIIPSQSISDIFDTPDSEMTSVEELMDDFKHKGDEAKSSIKLAQEAQKKYIDSKGIYGQTIWDRRFGLAQV